MYTEKMSLLLVGSRMKKGFDLLAQAWKIVCRKHNDWHLQLYGGGDKNFLIQTNITIKILPTVFK